MIAEGPSDEGSGEVRRALTWALGALGAVALLLGALHWLYGEVRVAGIYWFNLDKERNVPTWFSGVLFALLGAAALAAYYWERRRNRDGEPCFRLPWLWLVAAAVGFCLSLDEITVLHENLFWREVRELSAGFGEQWRYVTQWQLVYAPGIVLVFGFLAAFCAGRLQTNRRARTAALVGVSCWIGAMFLEGLREGIKGAGESSYAVAVLIEEELEMLGAILLVGAVAFHAAAIAAADLASAQRRAIATAPLFGARALEAVGAMAALLVVSAATIYAFAGRLAQSGAPVPRLVRLALEGAQVARRTDEVAPRGDATAPGPDAVRDKVDTEEASVVSAAAAPSEEGAAVAKPSAGAIAAGIWFGDLDQPLPPDLAGSATGIESLLRWAIAQPGADEARLPKGVRDDRAPRIVFLAAGDGEMETSVYVGRGTGVLAAVADANGQARAAAKGAGEDRSMRWRRLDVVASVTPVPPEERATTRLRLRHRVEGIAFEAGSGVALSPGELVGQRLIGADGILGWVRVLQYLRWRQPAGVAAPLRPAYRFTTVSAAADGARVMVLERGLPPVRPEDPGELLDAARLGGRYLTAALDADGRFTYRYQADTGTVRSGYNIVRHAGTVYSLLELHEATGDAQTLAAAERALGFLLRQVKPVRPVEPVEHVKAAEPANPANPVEPVKALEPVKPRDAKGNETECAGLVEDGEVKLGGNALAVVALAKHAAVTGRGEHVASAVALGEWILAAQDQNGRFAIHQQTLGGERASGFASEYYPGEAILALVRLHVLAPRQDSQPWLDAAERGARWLITVRDGEVPDEALPHDHWLLYALNELYRLRPDPIFLTHARRLARAIIASQHREPAIAEWRGGYYEPPRTTPTATRSEGLAAAYALLRDSSASAGTGSSGTQGAELKAEADAILEAIRLGIGFQLRTQIVPATAIDLPQPGRALGGFHNTLDDYEVRIDYVQHNISSLLALARILPAGRPPRGREKGGPRE